MSESATRRLPARASLEQLRKQAKDLHHACAARDAAALARVHAHKPQAAEPTLSDAQFTVAREYGCESWPSLVARVEKREATARAEPHGLSAKAPFYRIDWSANVLEPRQPLAPADWDTLVAVMREHGITGLNARGQLTDDALARVSTYDQLTMLHADGTKRLTDAGLAHLARMPQLEDLDLSEHPGGTITSRGLEALRHLTALRRFAMCWQAGISDAGTAHLAFCDRLERVDLLGSPTGDGTISALRGKAGLRHFKTGRNVTDAGLALLGDFPVFRTWQGGTPRYDLMTFGTTDPNHLVLDGPFTNSGMASLAKLDGLFGLGFFWHVSRLTPDGLAPLAELPNLGALGCMDELCNDTAMRHVAAIPRLRHLQAQGTVATDDGFAALSASKTIEHIWGRGCPNLRGRGFSALASMPALQGLAVSCKFVDDAALAALPTFPALRWLIPMDVSDAGFRHVGRCVSLEKLTCMYCRDTGDATTEHLTGLTHLAEYYAGETRITDRSLEILGGISSLEVIELSACKWITDAGLAHIARLPRLRRVSVDETARVSRVGLAVFPVNVQVDFFQ